MGFRLGYTIASVLAVVLSLGVGGCATQAQREFQAMATNQKATLQAFSTCFSAVRNSPDYAPIRGHLPPHIDDATLEQLMDPHLVTDDEKTAIFSVHPREQACRTAAMQQLGATNAFMVTIFTGAYNKSDNDLISLIENRQSWGEYVKRSKELKASLLAELNREDARIMAGLNLSHQVELDRRQTLAIALLQHSQNQQIIANMNRPVVTDCTRFGYSVNCVSH